MVDLNKIKEIVDSNKYFDVTPETDDGKTNIEILPDGMINVDGIVILHEINPLIKFNHVSGSFYYTGTSANDLSFSPRIVGTNNNPAHGLCVSECKLNSLKGYPEECNLITLIYHPNLPLLSLFKIKNLQTIRFIKVDENDYTKCEELLPLSNMLMKYLPMGIRAIPIVMLKLQRDGKKGNAKL